jgi:metal transporter CNNM
LLLLPFAFPLAKCLDWMLGRELASTYSNSEMMHLLKIHVQENVIDQEAANAMTGALTYKHVTVKEVMTPMERTFMLGVDEKLSFETIGKIFKTGYSRIPIYEIQRSNVVGILLVKDLIFIDPEDEVPIRSFIQIFGRSVHAVWPDDTLGEVLAELKKGRSHLSVVRDVNNEDESQDPFYEVKGIITLEDIVERILGDSIVDETDAYADSNQIIKVDRVENFEWARLRLLDTKIVDEMLSASEISAVTAHLRTNYPDCFKLLTDSQLTRLVSGTPVTTFSTATQDVRKCLPNELLYENGVPNDAFSLILSGKVTIFVGSENFRADLSSWSVLGKAALENKSWAPDFTAFVSDGPCRCIQIRHDAFAEAVDASVAERRAAEHKIHNNMVDATASFDNNDATSMGESSDGEHVPNRRGSVLAKLFNVAKPDCTVEDGDRKDVSTVQFADCDPLIVSNHRTDDTKTEAPDTQEQNEA